MQLTPTSEVPTLPVRDGVTITPLRMDARGAGTFLMHYAAGTRCPAHVHPDGEEIYVISGEGRLDDLPIQAGDFIWTPPGGAHVLYAKSEVVIHVTLPGPVVVTE